jgi:hypothetical protein
VAKPVTIESSGLKVPGNLRETGEMHFPNGNILQVHADDLIELSTLGRGTYGYVTLNKHVQSDLKFAVKHIKQQDDINVGGCTFVHICAVQCARIFTKFVLNDFHSRRGRQ